ncbi:MAG: hypothetical protein RSB28_06735 [Oscillospiraceae bacterium]
MVSICFDDSRKDNPSSEKKFLAQKTKEQTTIIALETLTIKDIKALLFEMLRRAAHNNGKSTKNEISCIMYHFFNLICF